MASHTHPEVQAESSNEVRSAADQVAITRSILEKRKIDREIEENEDWFRSREHQKAAAEAAARQSIEAKQAEQRRQQWVQQWTQYALNSLPYNARREVELEVQAAVDAVLSELQSIQADAIIQRLLDAAVHRALIPWTRKQNIERALEVAMKRLPWDVQHSSEYAQLKQSAYQAAVEGIRGVRSEAIYREMEMVAVQAVQPMIREYEQHQDCQRIVRNVRIFDATREEEESAREAVRKALATLPIGAVPKELEKAHEAAIAPYKAAVARRMEKERLAFEKQARRHVAERRADLQLAHIARYLVQEYTFDGYSAMRRKADRLRPVVREELIEELLEDPHMSDDEIRETIEYEIDESM
jgi:hypothetical protein